MPVPGRPAAYTTIVQLVQVIRASREQLIKAQVLELASYLTPERQFCFIVQP